MTGRVLFTWRVKVGAGPVDRHPSTFTVPWDGNLVPSTVIDPPGCGFDFNTTRTQIQVEVNVSVDKFDCKVITLIGFWKSKYKKKSMEIWRLERPLETISMGTHDGQV